MKRTSETWKKKKRTVDQRVEDALAQELASLAPVDVAVGDEDGLAVGRDVDAGRSDATDAVLEDRRLHVALLQLRAVLQLVVLGPAHSLVIFSNFSFIQYLGDTQKRQKKKHEKIYINKTKILFCQRNLFFAFLPTVSTRISFDQWTFEIRSKSTNCWRRAPPPAAVMGDTKETSPVKPDKETKPQTRPNPAFVPYAALQLFRRSIHHVPDRNSPMLRCSSHHSVAKPRKKNPAKTHEKRRKNSQKNNKDWVMKERRVTSLV